VIVTTVATNVDGPAPSASRICPTGAGSAARHVLRRRGVDRIARRGPRFLAKEEDRRTPIGSVAGEAYPAALKRPRPPRPRQRRCRPSRAAPC
jgi:hypothetical protein